MKRMILLIVAFLPALLFAQEENTERIIITKKGAGDEKMNIVIDGRHITVNGKPVSEDDEAADISVRREKAQDVHHFSWDPEKGFSGSGSMAMGPAAPLRPPNKAMLGVITEKKENGAKVLTVTAESAAEKAGMKKGDVITEVDSKKVAAPEELSEVLKNKNPGDKIKITYTREGKKKLATAELTKWSAAGYKMNPLQEGPQGDEAPDQLLQEMMKSLPRNYDRGMQWYKEETDSPPILGIKIMEEAAGVGVKVIEVQKGSAADKAGVKEGDIIKEANGKAIENADDMLAQAEKNRPGSAMKLKVNRKGRTQNLEAVFEKKIKTADL